jgi:branched-chain amino acid transport system ATP-binding protein
VSVVLSEQNIHFARLVADRVYMLEKGNFVYSGPMEALANDPETSRKYLSM